MINAVIPIDPALVLLFGRIVFIRRNINGAAKQNAGINTFFHFNVYGDENSKNLPNGTRILTYFRLSHLSIDRITGGF
jgi:hypothetical protein